MRTCLPLLALACGAPEPAPEPPPEPVAADGIGPYEVGATTVVFEDERGQTMTLEVWYPASPDEGAEPEDYGRLSIVRDAYRDAPADLRGAPYPMVAFSHGNGGIRYQSSFLTERLASHGFVVVSPDHPGSNFLDYDSDRIVEVAVVRPTDVRIAVDELVARSAGSGRLAGLVEDGPYGMVGHSFGAWTSLVVGGGELDLDKAQEACAEDPIPSCQFFQVEGPLDLSTAVPDPRVAVTIPLAPGAPMTFADLSGVTNPVLLGGREDEILPYEPELLPLLDLLPTDAPLLTFERSGHWSFTDLCEILDTLEDCAGEERGFSDPRVVQRHTNTLVTAALREHLTGGVEGDADWLRAEAWEGVEDVTLSEAGER